MENSEVLAYDNEDNFQELKNTLDLNNRLNNYGEYYYGDVLTHKSTVKYFLREIKIISDELGIVYKVMPAIQVQNQELEDIKLYSMPNSAYYIVYLNETDLKEQLSCITIIGKNPIVILGRKMGINSLRAVTTHLIIPRNKEYDDQLKELQGLGLKVVDKESKVIDILNMGLTDDSKIMDIINRNIMLDEEDLTLGLELHAFINKLNLSDERCKVLRQLDSLTDDIDAFGTSVSIKEFQSGSGLQKLHSIKILKQFVFNVITNKDYDTTFTTKLEKYLEMSYTHPDLVEIANNNDRKINQIVESIHKNNNKRQIMGLPAIETKICKDGIELICDNLDCFKFKQLPDDKYYILEYDSLRGVTLDIRGVSLFFKSTKDMNSLLLNPNNKLNYWESIFNLYKHAHVKLKPEVEIQMWRKILWIIEDINGLNGRFNTVLYSIQTVLGNWVSPLSHSALIMVIKNRIKELQDDKK